MASPSKKPIKSISREEYLKRFEDPAYFEISKKSKKPPEEEKDNSNDNSERK